MTREGIITITIHLVHGDPIRLEAPITEAREIGLSADLERALNRTSMAIELDGRLLVIPYSNIKYVEADPAPSTLPLNIICGAKRLP